MRQSTVRKLQHVVDDSSATRVLDSGKMLVLAAAPRFLRR